MNNDYRSPAFKKWLDKLQQESWQLELIISGFAIYALILAYEPININIKSAQSLRQLDLAFIWGIIYTSWSIFVFNLTLHVILRSLWIGALGLRYVSGEIDYSKLNYSEQFTKYLKKKIGSFDHYIAKLENFCSVLFAISFLVFFYFLGFIMFLIVIGSIGNLVMKIPFLVDSTAKLIKRIFFITSFSAAFFVFIDFISRGFFKKNKLLAKIYFPIYRVFSYLTLSFLYRPLVYNFLDNNFGRKLSVILIPFYLGIAFLTTVKHQNSNYIFNEYNSSKMHAIKYHYDDLLIDRDEFANIASIPSKVITQPYLRIFVLFFEETENHIFMVNKKLKPSKDLRGYNSSIVQEIFNFKKKEDKSLIKDYLNTYNIVFNLKIDSLDYKSDFIISLNQKDQLGFETYLNIRDLSEGKHILRILSPPLDSTKTTQDTLVTIPFWHYKK